MNSFREYYLSSLRSSSSYSAQQILKRLDPEKVEAAKPLEIKQNDIILGFKTEDFRKDNVQLLDIGLFNKGESSNINIAFLGITGTGKTAEAYKFAENFIYRYDNFFFSLDIKGEAWIHKKPLSSLAGMDQLETVYADLGQEPKGLDLLIIAPRSIIANKHVDRYFSVDWAWIKDIAFFDQNEAVRILAGLLGIASSNDDAIDLLDRAVEKDSIDSMKAFYKFIKDIYDKEGVDYAGSSKVLAKLKPRMDKGLLSDDPRYKLNLLEELKQRKGKGGVVFQGKIKVAGLGNYIDLGYESCVQLCLTTILYNGLSWNVSKDEKAILKSDGFIHIPELDTLASDDDRNQMSLYLRNYYTKSRQAGINNSCDVQEVSTVDHELMAQVRIFCCAKVSESNAKALEKKGIDKVNIKYLQQLRMEVWPTINGKRIGYKLAERVIIGKNNEILVYVPSPSQSQFMFKGA